MYRGEAILVQGGSLDLPKSNKFTTNYIQKELGPTLNILKDLC